MAYTGNGNKQGSSPDGFRDVSYLEPWYIVRAHESGKILMLPRTMTGSDGRTYVKFRGTDYPLDRVVASAFVPNPDCCSEVIHRNGDLSDNSAANLEWSPESAGTFREAAAFYSVQQLHGKPVRLCPDNPESGDCADTVGNCVTSVADDGVSDTVSVTKTGRKSGAVYRCDLSREVYEAVRAHVIERESERIRGDMEKRLRSELSSELYASVKKKVARKNIMALAKSGKLVFVPDGANIITDPKGLEKAMLGRLASICAMTIDDPEMFDGFLNKFAEKLMHSEIRSVVLDDETALRDIGKRLAVVEKRVSKEAVLERRNMLREEKEEMKSEIRTMRQSGNAEEADRIEKAQKRREEEWESHWERFGFEEETEKAKRGRKPKRGPAPEESGKPESSAEIPEKETEQPNAEPEKKPMLPESAMKIPYSAYDMYGTVEVTRTVARSHVSDREAAGDISLMYKEPYAASRGEYRKRPMAISGDTVGRWAENPQAVLEEAAADSKYANPLMNIPELRKFRRQAKYTGWKDEGRRENLENIAANAAVTEAVNRDETAMKMAGMHSKTRKRVIATYPNGSEREFGSLVEASDRTGCRPPDISKCCRGLKGSVHGIQFRFADIEAISEVLAKYAESAGKYGIEITESGNENENDDIRKT